MLQPFAFTCLCFCIAFTVFVIVVVFDVVVAVATAAHLANAPGEWLLLELLGPLGRLLVALHDLLLLLVREQRIIVTILA